jgi:hypothetical protein
LIEITEDRFEEDNPTGNQTWYVLQCTKEERDYILQLSEKCSKLYNLYTEELETSRQLRFRIADEQDEQNSIKLRMGHEIRMLKDMMRTQTEIILTNDKFYEAIKNEVADLKKSLSSRGITS